MLNLVVKHIPDILITDKKTKVERNMDDLKEFAMKENKNNIEQGLTQKEYKFRK